MQCIEENPWVNEIWQLGLKTQTCLQKVVHLWRHVVGRDFFWLTTQNQFRKKRILKRVTSFMDDSQLIFEKIDKLQHEVNSNCSKFCPSKSFRPQKNRFLSFYQRQNISTFSNKTFVINSKPFQLKNPMPISVKDIIKPW